MEWRKHLTKTDIPDSISVADFINTNKAGRKDFSSSRSPYTCGVTGQSRSAAEVAQRVDFLARGLAKNVAFDAHDGTAWDRVVAIYALNTVSSSFLNLVIYAYEMIRLITSLSRTPFIA